MNETNFNFNPIVINKGRKYRGIAYDLGYEERCYSNWVYTSYSLKVWNPVDKRYEYVNPDFIEKRDCSSEQIELDRKNYIETIVSEAYSLAKASSTSEEAAKQYTRNMLLKYHPEFSEYINEHFPDTRDVVNAIENAIKWYMNVKTRPMELYGRHCEGGKKKYTDKAAVRKAFYWLHAHGFTESEGFKESWILMTNLYGLPSYGVENEVKSFS